MHLITLPLIKKFDKQKCEIMRHAQIHESLKKDMFTNFKELNEKVIKQRNT